MSNEEAQLLLQEMRDSSDDGELFQRALDHALEYLKHISGRRVAPSGEAITALENFREPLPETIGEPFAIIDQLHELGSPGTMAQTGGRFFGLVNGGALPSSLATRILADAWDQNAVLHAISPVNAVIEEVCQNWLIDLLGLPAQTVAGFVSGTSMAIMCSLAAARWRLCEQYGFDFNTEGWRNAPNIRVVTGEQTHSTVMKAIALLGFGTAQVELVDVDEQGRLIAEKLPKLDDRTILILQAGNVNSGAFDPLRKICKVARQHKTWVHIDGAFGLWAAASKTLSHLTDGLELAQSWSVDAHKTLNVPYDSGLFLCADKDAAINALQNSGAYIMYSDKRDGMLFTPEMSRRARAIDLWGALKYLGRDGVDLMVSTLHERAVQFADELADAGFNVLNDVVFNQVLVSVGDEQKTHSIITHIQNSGEAWVGGSNWFGKPVIRMSVCSWATTQGDVTRSVQAFIEARKRTESK